MTGGIGEGALHQTGWFVQHSLCCLVAFYSFSYVITSPLIMVLTGEIIVGLALVHTALFH